MPFASEVGGKTNKAGKDQGFLANALGRAVDIGTDISPVGLVAHALGKDVISEEDAKANVRGATDMLSPSTLVPAVGGAVLGQLRAVPTAMAAAGAAATGGLNEAGLKQLENSPLSFAFDTANLRKQQELFNRNEGATGLADKFNAGLGLLSPAAQGIQQSFAETGLRGGAAVGSGITQTGLAGPRLTPNEAAELIGVPSYGEAAKEGKAGAMLLGDILNVAPALKGAGLADAGLNPLANTTAGARIAEAGAALERAPLAPYSIPAKGAYEAFQRGMVGADAFPQLAEIAGKEIPVVSKAAGAVEEGAQKIGRRWAGAKVRAEGLKQQGMINRAARQEIDTIQSKIDDLEAAAPDSPELQQAYEARDALHSELKQDAARETKYEIVRWADQKAKELGVPAERLQPTNAFGKIINEVSDEMAQNVAAPASEAFNAPGGASQLGLPGIEPASAGKVEGLYPKAIREELKASEKLQPKAVREIPEHFTDDSIRAHMRGLDAPTLPEGVGGEAVKLWDQMMTTWKTGVLPLRPAWHTTNIVGNVMGGLLMGEVSPMWFAKNIKRINSEVHALENGHPSELLGASTGRGLGVETARDIANVSEKGLQGKVKNVAQKSYGFNQKVDDFSHVAVALHELDRQLAAGIPKQAAVDAAEAFSLKTMGDFGNMSAGERSMVRRVLPFYPWYKHVSKATLRFPMENPGRFLQAQATAQRLTGGQTAPEGADFLKGAIPMGGGRFLRVGGDIGLGVENNPLLDPTATFQGAAPPLQWLGAAGGLNLARGRELQTAPGQSKASAIAGYAINQLPITKTLADLADTVRGQGGIVRGDTRAPIISGGRPIKESAQGIGFLPPGAVQYLSGLNYQEANLPAMAAREKKAQKTEKSKEKAYQKAVKKKPKK